MKPLVLVVDDEAIARTNLVHILTRGGCEVVAAANGAEAIAELRKAEFDLVVTDLRMEKVDGMGVLEAVKAATPETEVIVVTGYATVATAVEAIQKGAYHYLAKPFQIEDVRILVEKALEKRRLTQEVRELRRQIEAGGARAPLLVGNSAVMESLRALVAQVAPTDSTALILGETGTGKELVARGLHLLGRRSGRRFLAVNCGTFSEDLLASELFGHERGAFSGAAGLHRGIFEAAEGGTIFLDEIADMSTNMQVKLLRAIQERVVRRIGGTEDVAVDVRLIAATNKDLRLEVERGAFRQDLYFRLNVIVLQVPPLRDRREDIPLLVRHFLAKYAKELDRAELAVSPEVLDVLGRYVFPGNVRELENIVERAVVLAEGPRMEVRHLPADLVEGMVEVRTPCNPFELMTLEENEKRYLAWVLEKTEGNRTQAAKVLGIDRASLWRKIKRLGLD